MVWREEKRVCGTGTFKSRHLPWCSVRESSGKAVGTPAFNSSSSESVFGPCPKSTDQSFTDLSLEPARLSNQCIERNTLEGGVTRKKKCVVKKLR